MRMFTTIRDESDRLLKSATVLLISFDSVPLLSFLLHSTCAGVACYIGIRVAKYPPFWKQIVQWMGRA